MVTFDTPQPIALLSGFDAAIAKGSGPGSVTTWTKVSGLYTHTSTQYGNKAYFSASTKLGKLEFRIVRNKNFNVTTDVYAYYHGHLIETFLRDFDHSFVEAHASAMPVAGENVSGFVAAK